MGKLSAKMNPIPRHLRRRMVEQSPYSQKPRLLLTIFLACCYIYGVASPGKTVLAQTVPVPEATLSIPESVFIGESFDFTVTFDNNSPVTGYGPYIDLIFPLNGVDGPPTKDGIDFTGATYLGAPVVANRIHLSHRAGLC